MHLKSVLVIGAGPAGMAQCNVLAQAKGLKVRCFEMGSDPGGLWTYTDKVGNVHQSMYRYHQTNGLNEMLEFPGYSFADHFGHFITSYPPRAVMLDYLNGYLKKQGGDKLITLNRKVVNVTYDAKESLFTVISEDTKTASRHVNTFDYVVVATGHFSVPNYPKLLPGIKDFEGFQIHSHSFRNASEYAGKNIMLIGNGYSGEDIAMQCVKFGATSATVAYRTGPMGHDFKSWPIYEKKLPTHFDGKSGKFLWADGSSLAVDGIIYCTGYKHSFPFLSDELKLKSGNRLIPNHLWKGILFSANPQLLYLGMPDQYYTFSMFEAQGKFVLGVIEGRVKVPSQEDMDADTLKWQSIEDNLVDDTHKKHHRLQHQHTQEAAKLAGASLRDDSGHFDQWLDDRHHGILTYRDQTAVSSVDGVRSLQYCLPWTEMFTDDKEAYLIWCKNETARIKAGGGKKRKVSNGH